MVRLRLTRMGRKKHPFYRIVAADSRAPRDGRFIEALGYYDPMKQPADIRLDLGRVDYWLGVGASPSDTVASIIKRHRGVGQAPAAPEPAEAPEAAEAAEGSES
jgi:small subunit ribosomal protein S16